MFGNRKPWCIELWYDEDLAAAMDSVGVPVTHENLSKMRKGCKGIFDDKSDRNEMLADKAYELFGREK